MAITSIEDGQVAAGFEHLGERIEAARSFYAARALCGTGEYDQLDLEAQGLQRRLAEIARVRAALSSTIDKDRATAGSFYEEGVKLSGLRESGLGAQAAYVQKNLFDKFERNLRKALHILPAEETSEDDGPRDATIEGAYLVAFLLNPSLVIDDNARAAMGVIAQFAFDRYKKEVLGKRFYSDTLMRFFKKAIEIGLLPASGEVQLERTLCTYIDQTASSDGAL